VEHKSEAMKLMNLYLKTVDWFMYQDLLPEKSCMSEPSSSIPYYYYKLNAFTNER
jgi:hypothetical protein